VRYSLSVSHATRLEVNRKCNLLHKTLHPEAIKYEAPPRAEHQQSFWAWPGQELIGAGGRVKKGLFYTVVSCDFKRLVVEGNGETITVSAEHAARCLRLSHCLTYAACQGLSLAGVRLLETNSPHFGWRHLYVGASRCTSAATLEVT